MFIVILFSIVKNGKNVRNWEMDKQNITQHFNTVLLLRNKMKWSIDTCNGVDEPQVIMLSKSSQIEYVSDDCIYMNCPENSKSVETEKIDEWLSEAG